MAYCINLAITALIVFGASFVPGVGLVTDYGMTIAGIFIGVIYGYCTVGVVIPSFMGLIALGFSGFATVPEVLGMSFGSDTVLYIIAILLLSAMFQQCKLSDKLVDILISNKLVKGKPWGISIMFMLASYLVSLFVNAAPAVLICWALLIDLFDKTGYKRGEKWPTVMMFGVMYTATVGACVPSFQISIVANYGVLAMLSQQTLVFNQVSYMCWSFLCSVVFIAAYLVFVRYVIRPDMGRLASLDVSSSESKPFTKDQKSTIGVFLVFVLGLLLPSILPADNLVCIALNTLGNSGWGLLMVLVALLIQSGDHPLYEFAAVFSRGVIWEVVLMIATIFTIVGAITDSSTGLSELMVSMISPLQQSMGPLLFLFVIVLIFVVLSNLTNTVATSMLFIPILYTMSLSTDFNMFLFVGITIFVGNISFLLPSATPNAVMVFGQAEWIPRKYCIIFAVFSMIATYVIMMLVGLPLSNVFLA